MDAPSLPASAPKPKRRLGCTPIALIVFGVCAGILPIGAYAFAVFYVHDRVDARTEEILRLRQQGIPTNVEELEEWYYTDPEARKLGDAFIEIFGVYKASQRFYNEEDFAKHMIGAGEQPVLENIEALRTHLDLNAQYMTELRRLLQEPREVQYAMDFSRGFDVDIEFAKDARIAVSMFVASANLAVMNRDIEGFVKDIADAVHMAETLRYVPVLIVQLIRNACIALALDQCEYAFNATQFPGDATANLKQLLDTLELDGMTKRGVIGELCFSHEDVLFADDPEISEAAPILGILHTGPTFMRDLWMANLFLSQCEIIRIGDATPWERRSLADQFDQKFEDQWSLLHVLDMILTPAVARSYEAENRILSMTEIARAGLAVLLYAGDTGTLPKSVDALVPQYLESVPLDPFDGQPLRYKLTQTGFVVYSIADDRVDNGGVPPADDKKIYETGDLVFRMLDASPYLQQ